MEMKEKLPSRQIKHYSISNGINRLRVVGDNLQDLLNEIVGGDDREELKKGQPPAQVTQTLLNVLDDAGNQIAGEAERISVTTLEIRKQLF